MADRAYFFFFFFFFFFFEKFLENETRINPKLMYKYLNDKNKIISKVVKENPYGMGIYTMSKEHVYGVTIPTGEALLRYHIVRTLPKFISCNKGDFTIKHI